MLSKIREKKNPLPSSSAHCVSVLCVHCVHKKSIIELQSNTSHLSKCHRQLFDQAAQFYGKSMCGNPENSIFANCNRYVNRHTNILFSMVLINFPNCSWNWRNCNISQSQIIQYHDYVFDDAHLPLFWSLSPSLYCNCNSLWPENVESSYYILCANATRSTCWLLSIDRCSSFLHLSICFAFRLSTFDHKPPKQSKSSVNKNLVDIYKTLITIY